MLVLCINVFQEDVIVILFMYFSDLRCCAIRCLRADVCTFFRLQVLQCSLISHDRSRLSLKLRKSGKNGSVFFSQRAVRTAESEEDEGNKAKV